MTIPNFCIVIVCYDDNSRLNFTLDSIRRNSFSGKVIVKDGSRLSSTLELLGDYTELNIVHVRTPDQGLYDAMNEAVEYVDTDFFLTLNCGDQLRKFDYTMALESKIGVYFCSAELIFSNGVTKLFPPAFFNLNSFMSCCHQAMFINRRVFQQLGGYRAHYRIAADYDFVCRIIRSGCDFVFSNLLVVSFEADGGLSEKHRFVLEFETARIKARYLSVFGGFLVYLRHFFRYLKFQSSRKVRRFW